MALTYQNLTTASNKASGLADFFYWAPVNSFDTNGIQCTPTQANAADNASLVKISVSHVFKTDYGFLRVNCAPFKNNIESNLVGDAGSMKVMNQLKVFVPGSYADVHAQIKLMLNEPMIVLVQDSNCEEQLFYQLGCECAAAYIVAGGFKSGTSKDGVKGYEITIEYPAASVVLYAGAITFPSVDTGNPVP